jgi:hypothetical protein
MAKIGKSAAGYVHFDGTDYRCDECYKFEPDHAKQACAEVAGKIMAFGGCNTFVQGDVSQAVGVTLPRKLTQIEAGYMENKVGFSCKRCEYFLHHDWDCKKVDKDSEGADKGLIHPAACCNNWEKSPLFGAIA